MNEEERHALEETIRERYAAGDTDGAITAAMEGYGPDILGFLMMLMKDRDEAYDAFLQYAEDLVKGIDKFHWESSFRTWAYAVARNAMRRHYRKPHHNKPHVPISRASAVGQMAEQVRTRTLAYKRTEVKDRFARLREHLKPEDRVLLNLRIDKDMAWSEIAEILAEEEAPDAQTLKRKSAALRKRFERVKVELMELARKEGLLDQA